MKQFLLTVFVLTGANLANANTSTPRYCIGGFESVDYGIILGGAAYKMNCNDGQSYSTTETFCGKNCKIKMVNDLVYKNLGSDFIKIAIDVRNINSKDFFTNDPGIHGNTSIKGISRTVGKNKNKNIPKKFFQIVRANFDANLSLDEYIDDKNDVSTLERLAQENQYHLITKIISRSDKHSETEIYLYRK